MTVASARSQLNQPIPTAAPQVSSFETEAHRALRRIARNYNEHLDRVDRDAVNPLTGQIELTPALQAAHARFADTDDARGIDTVVQLVVENLADKRQRRKELRKSLVKEGDQAAETRATRRWQSDKDLLDANNGSLTVGMQLIEQAADDIELSVRLEQLPAYYAARGIDATKILDAAVTKRCPAIAQADSDIVRAERNAQVLKAGAQQLRNGIRSGTRFREEQLVNPADCKHNK